MSKKRAIHIQYLNTKKMVADILTKPATKDVFIYCAKCLGLKA